MLLLAHPVQEMPEWERWGNKWRRRTREKCGLRDIVPKVLILTGARVRTAFPRLICWIRKLELLAGRDLQYPPTSAPVLSPNMRSWKGGTDLSSLRKKSNGRCPAVLGKTRCRISRSWDAECPDLASCPPSETLLYQEQHIKRENKAALLWLQRLRRCQECENASRGNSFFSRKTGKETERSFDTFWAVGVSLTVSGAKLLIGPPQFSFSKSVM